METERCPPFSYLPCITFLWGNDTERPLPMAPLQFVCYCYPHALTTLPLTGHWLSMELSCHSYLSSLLSSSFLFNYQVGDRRLQSKSTVQSCVPYVPSCPFVSTSFHIKITRTILTTSFRGWKQGKKSSSGNCSLLPPGISESNWVDCKVAALKHKENKD